MSAKDRVDRQGSRLGKQWARAGQLLALTGIISTTVLGGLGTTVPAAHADVKHVTHVFDIPSNNDPANLGVWQRLCIRDDGLPVDLNSF